MKKYFSFLVLLLVISGLQPAFGQGFIIDDSYKSKFSSFEPEDKGFSADLPMSASLRKYAPTPRNQQGSTCMGWAAAYSAMSIQFNYLFNITDAKEKDAFAFDPYFLFHQIKDADNVDCEKGTSMLNALVAMQNSGVKRQLIPYHLVCANSMAQDAYSMSVAASKPFRIKDARVINIEMPEATDFMKYAITLGYPIIIGTAIHNTIEEESVAKHGAGAGLWEPNPKFKDELGGHAMCIVGYDDTKFGGAWEIMNSWGTGIGDKGFVWVKYSDFNQIAIAAAFVELYDMNTAKPACQFGDCADTYSRVDFGDEVYEGFVKGEYVDGWAYHKLKDGSIYCGPFVKGIKHGKGFYLTKDNQWYIVQLENGTLVDSQALGFSSKTAKQDVVVDASSTVLSSYLPLEEAMPDSPAIESGKATKIKK